MFERVKCINQITEGGNETRKEWRIDGVRASVDQSSINYYRMLLESKGFEVGE